MTVAIKFLNLFPKIWWIFICICAVKKCMTSRNLLNQFIVQIDECKRSNFLKFLNFSHNQLKFDIFLFINRTGQASPFLFSELQRSTINTRELSQGNDTQQFVPCKSEFASRQSTEYISKFRSCDSATVTGQAEYNQRNKLFTKRKRAQARHTLKSSG